MLVNKWTKKNTIKYLGKVLSKNSVPWGKVKTFSQFLNTKTANNNLIKAKINNKTYIIIFNKKHMNALGCKLI